MHLSFPMKSMGYDIIYFVFITQKLSFNNFSRFMDQVFFYIPLTFN